MNPPDPNALSVTFLGTSSGVPTRQRNVSALALQLPQRAETWLLDCGEATQHQILRHPDLNASQIRRIFITHMHGDHIYGLPGLLATCGMSGRPEAMDIYGPPGLEDYLKGVIRYSDTHLHYPIQVHTVETGLILQEAEYSVYCAPLDHRVVAFGYRIVEHDRTGSFDVAKAEAHGIPFGPLYGRLKAGEQVTLPDGRILDGRDYVGSPQIGRKLAYCTDTTYCRNAVDLARAADLLIHEATYAQVDLALAQRSKHSTAMMAAQVAAEAKAQTLILTHFSPRYHKEAAITLEDLQAEAQTLFPHTLIAQDRLTYPVPRRLPPQPVTSLATDPSGKRSQIF
ncbi:MAG: ribonuclease Z [Cyanobacteriota bacterium]|nr:ribonuclease Z [Cyanobacteriota bacterium]